GMCLPLFLLVWHGDAVELDRHAMGIALQIRIALLLAGLLALRNLRGKIGRWIMIILVAGGLLEIAFQTDALRHEVIYPIARAASPSVNVLKPWDMPTALYHSYQVLPS